MNTCRLYRIVGCVYRLLLVGLLIVPASEAQTFHFGGNAALALSQVDGDNLKGFHKVGYSAGLIGGYSLSSASWIVVELQYTTFGSRHENEESPVRLETAFRTVNMLLGYSLRFGDAWDGVPRFRAIAGPRVHAVHQATLGAIDDREQVRSPFITLHLGVGMLATEDLLIDVRYNHTLGNILERQIPEIQKLTPYYLSIGLAWYLYR